ncbi:type II toxin-antitoxin system HipA family toxin [Zhihengliuella salsuginis]|uniref:Serine/threonine-protein kinase HipA n=1 Tax=Zhihengliuella salsuginis TaxID=578222 RepID=A0ABQ3GJP2_9MICC|nr:HipA domain-containing protein [Zhihengliuella salsuginis]GHD08001.1 hypothetical protein GCM10008096_19380 [Zhihengliuella salsuginis]
MSTGNLPGLVATERADVYKGGRLAAQLTRTPVGIEFRYTGEWVRAGGGPVASTLDVTTEPVVTTAGAVPAFFAGLLPEGRRLGALTRAVKTSADDELSLLLAVGADPVGDVQVVPSGAEPERAAARIAVDAGDFSSTRFSEVLADYDIDIDLVALPGVQDKASLKMLSLPVHGTTSEYILKLDPPEYPRIVENEAFFLDAARASRVRAVRAEVVVDADGVNGLAVERFDRQVSGDAVRSYAVEDGCQALGLHPEAKYRVSTEEVVAGLAALCEAPVPAAMEFLRQVVFAYVSGNGDAHAKNFSVVAGPDGRFRPAPAYDLPCTYLYGDSTMAMSIDGARTTDLTRGRFVALAEAVGVRPGAAARVIDTTVDAAGSWLDSVDTLPFEARRIHKLKRFVRNRLQLLSG